MPRSIDQAAQKRRREDAWISAALSTLWLLLSAAVLLWLRWKFLSGFWSAVLLIIAVLELGCIIPVWILLKIRLKEIEGGEEDAAAEY